MANFTARVVHYRNAGRSTMGTRQQGRTYDQADEDGQSYKNCRNGIRPPHFHSHVSYLS